MKGSGTYLRLVDLLQHIHGILVPLVLDDLLRSRRDGSLGGSLVLERVGVRGGGRS